MKRILITGASRGIGKAIAERLASADTHMFIHGRDPRALSEVERKVGAEQGEVTPIVADLSQASGVEAILETVGREPLDVLVNNAGIAYVKPVETLSLEEWQHTLAVNVTAPFLLCRRLLLQMPRGAAVVNIMSIAARVGFANWSSYSMSKFALEGFSQSLREELRPRGIRVINVYPSSTNTDLWKSVSGDWPREKMLDSAQVAEAVAFALERPDHVQVDVINIGHIAGTL